jgi:hypothetical protein
MNKKPLFYCILSFIGCVIFITNQFPGDFILGTISGLSFGYNLAKLTL